MNDRERLDSLVGRIRSLEGLDEERFQRLTAELDRAAGRFGYDEGGRPKVALFDAKSYDIESFEGRNHGRFAIQPIEASLNVATAPAAEGHKVVCIFVNDTCDAKVVKALAALGVELVALRCAGFNNVDLAACRERGLSVVRVPEYSPYAVAEHTVGLMLMLNRGLHRAYERNRAGYFVLEGLTGFDMRGKTVGRRGHRQDRAVHGGHPPRLWLPGPGLRQVPQRRVRGGGRASSTSPSRGFGPIPTSSRSTCRSSRRPTTWSTPPPSRR